MHFYEIIERQFRKKNTIHTFILYCFLELLLLNYLEKMRGYPQFAL